MIHFWHKILWLYWRFLPKLNTLGKNILNSSAIILLQPCLPPWRMPKWGVKNWKYQEHATLHYSLEVLLVGKFLCKIILILFMWEIVHYRICSFTAFFFRDWKLQSVYNYKYWMQYFVNYLCFISLMELGKSKMGTLL